MILVIFVWKKKTDSDHMPVCARITFPFENKCKTIESCNDVIQKFVWNDENANIFHDNLCKEETHMKIDSAIEMIDTDINRALDIVNECIKDCASCMTKHVPLEPKTRCGDWFDQECNKSKKQVRKLLRISRRSLKPEDRHKYCVARREYKNLLARKKNKQYNSAILDNLIASVDNQKEFWNTVNRVSFKKKQQKSDINLHTWFQHFRSLLEVEVENSPENLHDVTDDASDCVINRPISKEEVLLAFRKLKTRKAAGPDGIVSELLKHSNDLIVTFFLKLFNSLFDKGIFPENWTESIILPLFKKGNVNNPSNYRGISLSDVSSKIYSSIINSRLQEWVELNDITSEHQAGFKKGYSTTDHMFTLLALVQKQFSYKRKLYVAFIDFEKAFDSINRNLLWPILLKNGIKGKLFRCIKTMYNSVKCRVRHGARFTDYISCTAGVKQGDVCSPVLFSIFINELALEVIRNGRHGAMFRPDAFELFILLLADDVVLFSESVIGLQTQLNSLSASASSLQLKVNLDKSNIIIFRKGGYVAARERWMYNRIQMPVVNAYKYLGIYFSTRLSFSFACKDLVSRAKNASLCVLRKLNGLNNNSLTLLLKLFDLQIQPIVQYGSELWGLDIAAKYCESVHLFVLKKFLGVDMRTPNDLIYGETNRYPIYINSAVNTIRYWVRLLQMDEHRLPRKAYVMLYTLDSNGKNNWVSAVRKCLCEYGFGYVWQNQGVGCLKSFISVFRQRMVDCRWQAWNDHINTSERFSMYRSFSCDHDLKPYISLNIDRHLKIVTTGFRIGISKLFVHYFRYRKHNESDLICPLCMTTKEDEVHFVLSCQALSFLRERFIPAKYYRQPCLFKLCLLLSCSKADVVTNLSIFLHKAFKFRDIAIS